MAVKKIATMSRYTGAEGDSKPTGVQVGSTFWEYDTRILFITYDDGTNWEIKTSPPYEFTINGVNFDGYEKIKTLTLDGNAKDDVPVTLHDEGSDYEVGEGKVFIAFQALIYLEQNVAIGRIGEAASENGAIAKEVLKFSNGTNLPFMTDCIGVFAAGTFVTAETDNTNTSYEMVSGSVLYGVEVDA